MSSEKKKNPFGVPGPKNLTQNVDKKIKDKKKKLLSRRNNFFTVWPIIKRPFRYTPSRTTGRG